MRKHRQMAFSKKPLKIAFVQDPFDGVLPPNQSSIGLWTYHVVRHLPANCHATIFAKRMFSHDSQGDDAQIEVDNVDFRYVTSTPNRLWLRLSKLLSYFHSTRRPPFAALYHNLDYILQIALLIRKERFDVVHIHNFSQFVPVVRALNPQTKIVLHMHGEWLSQLDPQLIEPRIQKADAVFGSSKYITSLIQRRFPQYADACHTVYNGVDSEFFVPKHKETETTERKGPRLLFVGRVSPEKGVHILLDAFRIVAQQKPKVHLDILGPVGAMPKEFLVGLSDDAEVAELGKLYSSDYLANLQSRIPADLADQVTFHGHIAQSQLLEHYQATDILINPSFSESFGMSLVEAMACEKPVVATRVGGMQEIVQHGTTGLLVERNNATALAEAILQLLADHDKRAAMGKAGRKRVLELFAWNQVARCALHQYESVIQLVMPKMSTFLSN